MAIPRLAWTLLALALTGALASLFGLDQQLWGLNVGSLGATVFGFTLWVGAWLYARYPDQIFAPEWSIAERRAWTALVFVILILVAYLRFMWAVAAMPEVPVTLRDLPSEHFIAHLVVLFIAWAVVSSSLRGQQPDVIEADERDLRLRGAADHVGDWALTIVIGSCAGLLAFQPSAALAWWLTPLIAANVLVGILIVKTLIEHAYLVGRYAWDRR